MAGGRQAPSGTAFDPWPQFWVHEVVSSGSLTVTGRCWFAPVTAGTVFTALTAPGRHRRPAAVPCRLPVEEISAYGRLIGELDQDVSARLVLSGDIPPALGPGSVLIATASQEAGRWRRAGSLWIRASTATMPADARDDTAHAGVPNDPSNRGPDSQLCALFEGHSTRVPSAQIGGLVRVRSVTRKLPAGTFA
jgi:hypothetical protein